MTGPGASPRRAYLDFNATSTLRPQARAAILEALDSFGNASSVHREGRRARALVEGARSRVGAAVGRPPEHVVFVSGGTEAAAFALSGAFGPEPGRRCDALLVGAGEHSCMLESHGFAGRELQLLPLDRHGRLRLDALGAALDRLNGRTVALALQAANNETGVVQPAAEAFAMVRSRGGLTICDAVQALGRLRSDFSGADLLIVSGHKVGGPKGAGALVFDPDHLHMEDALIRGGGQERGRRAGTEAVPAIAGFGAACSAACEDLEAERARLAGLRLSLEEGMRSAAPDAVVFGAEVERLPNTCGFAVPGAAAETMLIALDLAGVAVSSGSACSSGKVKPSHVLRAMGIDADLARCALRASLGWSSTEADVAAFCEAFEKALRSVRSRGVGRAARENEEKSYGGRPGNH
jgi:cysteine desulfurase